MKHYYNDLQRLTSVVGDMNNLPNSIAKDGEVSKAKEYMNSFADNDTLVNLQVDYETNMLLPVLGKQANDSVPYDRKDNTYYYHGDHLGSATWITDGKGDLVEHRRYLPYGEEWYAKNFVEDRYTERFRFTGKERDEESGYDYFGARYYDAMLLTSWMSVDMMADFDAERTPYGYCRQNPLIHQDHDGNMPHVVVGSAIGAAVGAGFALYEGKSWSEVGAAAAGGAVMGAITAATGGLGGTVLEAAGYGAIGGAIGGVAGSLTEQGINVAAGNQEGINAGDVFMSGAVGAAFEGVGGVVNKFVGKSTEAAIGQIKSEYKSNYKSLYQQAKQDIKADYKKQGLLFNKSDIKKAARSKVSGFRDIDVKCVETKTEVIQRGITPTITNTAENATNHEIK